MRVAALLVLVLVLGGVARAEDDDGLLDTRPLGEAIPERLQTLEHEWADEVGTKEPADEPEDAAEEPHEAAPFEDDAEVPSKPRPRAEEPVPAKPKSTSTAKPETPGRRAAAREGDGGTPAKDGERPPEKLAPPPTDAAD